MSGTNAEGRNVGLSAGLDLARQPSGEEIEAVAEAMWNCGIDEDGRPAWDELEDHMDDGLMREFRTQAYAGLCAFIAMRSNDADKAPERSEGRT